MDGFVIDPWETGTRKEDKQGIENWGMVYSISTPDIKVLDMNYIGCWLCFACAFSSKLRPPMCTNISNPL